MIRLMQLKPYAGDVASPSPNHGLRRAQGIHGIVLHATEDGGNERQTLSWLRSPKSQASCHLYVGRSGRVIRLVGDQQRAWHAGLAVWRGRRDVNSITLGIEIANRNDGEPYTDAQYRRVAEIVAHYCRQGLSLEDVVGHADISPWRKRDPFGWDWQRFRTLVQGELRMSEPLIVDAPAVAPAPAASPTGAAASLAARQGGRGRAPAPPAKPARTHKHALRSRTLWLNGITALAAGAALFGEVFKLAFWVGLPIPQEVTVWLLFALGVVNIFLRFQTTQPLCNAERATGSGTGKAVRYGEAPMPSRP